MQDFSIKTKKSVIVLSILALIFIGSAAVCLRNLAVLKKPVFQAKTEFASAASAKYEKDGNLYIIDSGAFRLICMTPDGKINYTITIDKLKENIKIYDSAVDEAGNVYVYVMEMEYDAFLTKRDVIRKYDRDGKFVRDIFLFDYSEEAEDRPHGFAQFGSMRCEYGTLTFSRVQKNRVVLYMYNTFRDELDTSVFSREGSDYSVAKLALKDFSNFIYSTRDGNIYEVKNGGLPLLRASFDFTIAEGGAIPWHLDYTPQGDIVFLDMISGTLFRIAGDTVTEALPGEFFDGLSDQGQYPLLTGFGFFNEYVAGVYGEVVWYFDGSSFRTYEDGLTLARGERLWIITVQLCFVLGILTLLTGLYILFVRILDRQVSLFIKQTVIIIPITIAAFIVLYTVTFNLMMERLNKEIVNELNLATTISARMIDGDDIDALKSIKDFNSPAYKNLSLQVKKYIGNNRDEWNKKFYAGILTGQYLEHWVLEANDEINLFRPCALYDVHNMALLKTGKPVAGIFESIDGLWAYSDAPVYNSNGTVVGVFEMGLDMTSYQISNIMQRQRISVITFVICLVILLALTGVLSIIVKHLVLVAKVFDAIANGNYSARVRYRAKDELGTVSHGLNTMAEELQQQFEQISSLNDSTIRFVPVQFMEHLGVRDITKMKLGDNVQRNLTILFFDIRFFSINSEMMTARENFIFINKVTGIAGPIIRRHNGFIDKYIGDAVMALFADAGDAVRAGIEIYRKLAVDKETQVKIGVDGINIGVGIHSGSVMMGIVGENERLSSTVISPSVNMASRMESLTKQTKSGMLITRDTLNQIPNVEGEFQYRFIGMIQAAGVNEVVGVFDVLDALPLGIRKRRLATKNVFESGVRKYHMKEYQTACKRFEQVVAADPEDICAVNCLEEAQRHLKDPALPSVFIFNKK